MPRLSTAFAQFIVHICFSWGLLTLYALPFHGSGKSQRHLPVFYAFVIGYISSFVGFLRYAHPWMEIRLQNVDAKLASMTQSLFPALVTSELVLKHWPCALLLQDHLIRLTLHFLLLMASFWLYESQSSQRLWPILMVEKETVTTRKIFVALALADSIVAQNFDGIVGSLFMMLGNLFVGTVGLFFEVPSRDFHSYLQCFCNYHILQAVVE
ncbi:uncharacterized protein LOC132195619 [Neocloeon triangulifer]|uniref:uncharacterized protein LOC132195619 n=1 Tax=Neocloeon triangulifer TaxID=2078957 RepID=UPI00286F0290|nr:uncharacterized protein LOC132195619 [Neocloeon triangulifer]